jgi:hypothetical protein
MRGAIPPLPQHIFKAWFLSRGANLHLASVKMFSKKQTIYIHGLNVWTEYAQQSNRKRCAYCLDLYSTRRVPSQTINTTLCYIIHWNSK